MTRGSRAICRQGRQRLSAKTHQSCWELSHRLGLSNDAVLDSMKHDRSVWQKRRASEKKRLVAYGVSAAVSCWWPSGADFFSKICPTLCQARHVAPSSSNRSGMAKHRRLGQVEAG